MRSRVGFKLFSETQVKLKKISLTLYMRCFRSFLDWKLNFSETQVKLKKLSLALSADLYQILITALRSSQTQVKLKSGSLILYFGSRAGFNLKTEF